VTAKQGSLATESTMKKTNGVPAGTHTAKKDHQAAAKQDLQVNSDTSTKS